MAQEQQRRPASDEREKDDLPSRSMEVEDTHISSNPPSDRDPASTEKHAAPFRDTEVERQAPPNPAQDEAILAAKEALQAQMEAQDAIKKAVGKQLIAQEKSQQASQQIAAQTETANQAAVLAARQAAQVAAKEQHEATRQQIESQSVAKEAAKETLATLGGNEPGNLNLFPPNAIGGIGSLGMKHSEQQSFAARDMILQKANQTATEAQAQMQAAEQLAAGFQIPVAQQQAAAAQQQMAFAQQMALAAQSPQTAIEAAAALSNSST